MDFIYWSHSDQTHDKEDIPLLLTQKLLEDFPEDYYELLQKCSSICDKELISRILNNTTNYDTWFSTHAQTLFYLVGDRSEYSKKYISDYPESPFLGRNQEGITEELGIKIFRLMIDLGANLTIANYYGENIYDFIFKKDSIVGRVNNKNFINIIFEEYKKQIVSYSF